MIVVVLALFALLIYRFGSEGDLVYRVSQIVPYPAARINGKFISYGDYLFELRPLKYYLQNQSSSQSGQPPVDFKSEEGKKQLAQLRSQAMDYAKQKTIINQLAKEEGVTVSKKELDDEVNTLISQEGGEAKFKTAIKDYFDWNISDFKRAFKTQILQRKLLPKYSVEQRKQAEEISQKIKNGEDFAALATQYSQDTGSKDQGGDLGFSSRGAYVKEFEDAAFSLDTNQVSGIVETQYGFHIIKVTEKKDDQIRVSHILVPYADINKILEEKMNQGDMKIYIKGVEAQPQPQQQTQPQS